jgi:hypothetical protein
MEEWLSVGAGFVLVTAAAVNTVLMCETLGRRGAPGSFRVIHRWLGWVIVAGFVGFLIYMLPRAANFTAIYPHDIIHASLGFALLPAMVGKVLVVRRYKSYMGGLPTLGFAMFVALFVLIMLTAGYDLVKLVWGQASGQH